MIERIFLPLAKAAQESKETPAKVNKYTKEAEGIDRRYKLTAGLGLNPHEGNFARTYLGYKIHEENFNHILARLNEETAHAKSMADAREPGSTSNILLFRPMLGERRGKIGKLIAEHALYKASVENARLQLSEERGDERAKQIMGAVDEFLPLYHERRQLFISRERAQIADAKIDDSVYKWYSKLKGADQNVH